MLHQEFEPPEQLRDAIKCFWYEKRDFGTFPSSVEIVPDGYAEIIFYFGSECSISDHDRLKLLPSPFIMGLLNQPVLLHAKNLLEVIAVRCFPWTVFELLGLQPGKDGAQIFEHPITRLQPVLDELVKAGSINEAVVRVKNYFLDVRSGVTADNTLSKAGAAMREANGTMPVGEVAAAAHATVRTLERKFKQSSGHTVKDVSALMRFEQVRNRLWLCPDINLAGLAHELGYTDQAHLSKEFKRYSGTTPGAFARNAKKGKLAISNDLIALS